MTQGQGTLYQRVADRIEGLIRGGTLRPGERIPSVRKLGKQLSVSVSTVLEAYRLLEDRGFVEARPQSGYYVRALPLAPPQVDKTESCETPTTLEVGDLVLRIVREASRPDLVPLGAAVPSSEFLPTARLNRLLAQVVRRDPEGSQSYDTVNGLSELRVQIARRSLEAGCSLRPEDVITTAGAQEAIQLALRAVTRPGDTVAIESPTYYGLLEALESLYLNVIEIATDPRDGIVLEDLADVLQRETLAAVVLVANYGNPLGHCMPDDRKQQLLDLLEDEGVPLIEDDAYGDLNFGPVRPKAIKAFDKRGHVLLCSSLSKTLAPGYRIGWIVPGRYKATVERLKFSATIATATPTQMAVAEYLRSSGFDRYLRGLRRTYRDLVGRMAWAVGEAFPAGTRVTHPSGGHVLWVELPEAVDSIRLHEDALVEGISIAPGPVFSATGRYRNFIRINCAVPWSPRVESAVHSLGQLVLRQL
jgi:DNA-binding transcriptional MocR family regulator